jgi:peptide/nickel transport system ATP-binding protein
MALVLSVRDLSIDYRTPSGTLRAVQRVSFDIGENESLALIGESGCGKTTLGLALLGLLPKAARVSEGHIFYHDRHGQIVDIVTLRGEQLRRYRWRECAMVFQGALNAFNPVLRIWEQVLDTARAHGLSDASDIRGRIERLLELVQLDPRRVLAAYPHQLSGGMRQRVMIALSLLLEPRLVIYDEPTTALDILTQRAILEVLRSLRQELRFSMLFISHDLPLAAELADRVATMYAGRLVELGSVRDVFYTPRHPYTVGLVSAVPLVIGPLVEIASIPGAPPNLLQRPPGCTFHPRCTYAQAICQEQDPALVSVGDQHWSACHFWREVRSPREVLRSDD